MTDPREFNEQANTEDSADQIEQIDELDARVENDDEVKGGARRAGDPCDGGEIAGGLG